MPDRPTDSRRARGEEGITIILIALALVAIMMVVAIVIDLSNVRNSRQDSKLVADAAVTAGLQSLAEGGEAYPWRGACTALQYLQANDREHSFTIRYLNGNDGVVTPNPCNGTSNVKCDMDSTHTQTVRRGTWANIEATDGTYVVNIRTGYHTPDATFPEDAATYSSDNGTPAALDCDQLAVIVSRRDPAFFGGVAGKSQYNTSLRTVGRVKLGFGGNAVPAFLILERTDCLALQNSVGGASLGIIIRSPDGVQPGIAHVDSNGTGSNCTGSARAVVADTLPGGGTSLTVDSGTLGPGIIAINALAPGGIAANAYRDYPGGMNVQPTSGSIVSRKPIDSKYASTTTIAAVHDDAKALVNATTAPAGSTTVSTCNPNAAQLATVGAVYVECATFNRDAVWLNATSLTFSGNVDGGGKAISAPLAQRIVVRGSITVNGAGGSFTAPQVTEFYVKNGLTTSNGYELRINSTSGTACTGGTSTRTKMVVFSTAPTQLKGPTTLCSTFLYLAGASTTSYTGPVQTTAGGSCSGAAPCPSTAFTGPALEVNGAAMVWSAPNEQALPPGPGTQGIEDLAFWTESATTSQVANGGTIAASGVFFFPNAHVDFASPTSAQPRNAQFIARSLDLRQGSLEMKPVLSDSVSLPIDPTPGLVR